MRLLRFAAPLLLLLPALPQIGPSKKSPTAPPTPGAVADSPEEPILKTNVDLVNILFSVRDRKGQLVGNLEKPDFTVLEDGKPQTIASFTRETNLPLTIGLLVDVSKSQENLIEVERRAASEFFRQLLGPKDMAFLISFGSEAELLQDYTGSPKFLRAALDNLKVNTDPAGSVPTGVYNPGPVPTMNDPRGTILFDAVYLATNEKLKKEVGRKAVVVITDGMDQGSRISRDEAIESAQKADAIIYGIYYVDYGFYHQYGGGFGVSDSTLKRLATETGGRVFHIDRKNTLEDALKQIQEEMRTQYAISYTPSNPKKDGSFRKIEVRVANKDLRAQARKGYYATASE